MKKLLLKKLRQLFQYMFMVTHVREAINKISKKYNLKVIYDAAHIFGVKSEKINFLNYGDLSIISFHATKVFNTFEGGIIISHDKKLKDKIDALRNFGLNGDDTLSGFGLNAKMNEFSAALGLLQISK